MKKILVLFAHPNFERSRVHKSWTAKVQQMDRVTFHDLYELYPEFDIDVKAEQALLSAHDVIVLEHPLYWYSTPALIKQWLDLVLEHGFAYGTGGTALEGKLLLSAVSTGGKAEAYEPHGFHGITLVELLAPLRQTARLCKMHYLPPFVFHGAFSMNENEVSRSTSEYEALLKRLRDEPFDPEGTYSETRLASVTTSPKTSEGGV